MTAPVQVGPSTNGGPTPSLSPRESEALKLASIGKSYYQIARALGITENTVHTLLGRAFRKLGAVNMPHAVLLACRAGLLGEPPDVHLTEPPDVELSPALVRVLELVADGRTNEEIAQTLGRSRHTVITQVADARRRLGARDRAHAAVLAVEARLIRRTNRTGRAI